MKIAVCIFGEPRFYKLGHEYMKNFFNGCEVDYYIHSWANKENIEKNLQELSDFYSPKKILVEEYMNFEDYFENKQFTNFTSRPWTNVVSATKSIKKAGILLEETAEKYDYVCFVRTDVVALNGSLINNVDINCNKKIYSSFVGGPEWVLDKNNLPASNVGHIDGKFICSNKENMIYFSKLYDNMKQYVLKENLPFCHHRLIYHHMKELIRQNGHNLIRTDLEIKPNNSNGGWFFIRDNDLTIC